LEHGEYYSLGSDVRKLNTSRIILATQQSSEDLLRSGLFRKDLYYRIATHNVHLPPLRERKEDIPLLVHHFIELACRDLGKEISHIPPELYTLLSCYHFPGNIRELRSMVWNAISKQKTSMLSLESFRETIEKSVTCPDIEELRGEVRFGDRLPTLAQIHTVLIEEALSRSQGNLSVAADILGISRQALSKRLKR
jgi:transcriptional regulator with PAS, ATPase and Fis domain